MPLEQFYLGTHQPHWLERTAVPLFVSRRRLARLKTLPQARGPWAADSGAFMELLIHGKWSITVKQYIAEIRRYMESIGNLQWAAPMDHLCEPFILHRT